MVLVTSAVDPEKRRAPFPEGTLPVGIALLISGVATYAFFRVGTSALGGETEFKPISALWFATFSLAPGFFLPLEQELGRALAYRRANGEGGRPVVRRVVSLGAMLAGVVLLALAILSPVITEHYFDGDWVMMVALAVAFIAYAPAHLARGICSGTGRFRDYAVIMGSDGVVRIVLCLTLAAIGITAAGPYGFAVALAPLFAVGFVAARGHLKTPTWTRVELERGHTEPRLAAHRLGLRRRAAQRRCRCRHPAGRRRPEAELVTQFVVRRACWRGFRCSCSRRYRQLCYRGCRRLAARNELVEFRVRSSRR